MKTILIFVFIFHIYCAHAQDQESNQQFENLSNTSDPESFSENFALSLQELMENKLNLNKANRRDLQELNILTDFQISQFLNHREQFGPLLSLNELQVIEGFDYFSIVSLKPFVTIKPFNTNKKNFMTRFLENRNHYLVIKFENKYLTRKEIEDFNKYSYYGTPYKIAGRYRNSKAGDYSLGLTFEKDPGEKIYWNPSGRNLGFDFLSWHFSLFERGKIRCLTVGDFSAQFGQGLLWGNSFSLGKGTETITATRKNNAGLRPYSSFSESGYYKGIACVTSISRRIRLTAIYSNKAVDARTSNDSVISIIETGYHRDSSETIFKKTTREIIGGGQLNYSSISGNFSLGINAMGMRYNKSLSPEDQLYKVHSLTGNFTILGSIDYSYTWRNINSFGEIAYTNTNSYAGLWGIIFSLSKKIDYSFYYRNLGTKFHNPYSNAFRENTNVGNEKGLYQGVKISVNKSWGISAYADIFSFPWLKYQLNAPSSGIEFMLRTEYRFNRQSYIYLQYRDEKKEQTFERDIVGLNTRQSFAINIHAGFDKIYLTSKLVFNKSKSVDYTGHGSAISQDFGYKNRLFDLSLRLALYDTKSYENRIYMYEKDVLYSFSFPAYYGNGGKYYIITRFKISPKINLWIRFSRKIDFKPQKIQLEGIEEAMPNNELKLQIKYNFG